MLNANTACTPDYIFIDVNMPKMNGVDCLRMIKNIDRLKYTRMFMYSTTAEGMALEKSRELGADDFIIKPSSASALKEKLSRIFEIVQGIND
jgi:CheY-like chemotaxis protein